MFSRFCFVLFILVLTGVNSAVADEGMWLPNHPPLKMLKEKYSFEPSPQWLEHVQKSCVRFSSGGSGSIVSADGLVMTNHHVGSDNLEKLSTPQRNLLETGFYAKTRAEELKCEDLELWSLWTIEDVTAKVNSAAKEGMSAADANSARRKAMAEIEAEAEKRTGLDCQVVTLYYGGLYHLYCYKRYTDIRLVMAPEESAASFGGDTDNFEFPRHGLDMTFFRIYENGQPLKAEHHLKWSDAGAKEGDLTIVAGHPAVTQRQNTVAQVKFLRDVEYPANLRSLWRREVQAQSFAGRDAEHARMISGELGSIANSRKAMTGVMAGLLDPAIMADKVDQESKLRKAVEADTANAANWGDAWEHIERAQYEYAAFFDRYGILESRRRALRTDLFTIAKTLVRLADELPKPSGERLREYRDSELDSLYLELYSPAPIYDELEIHRLNAGLTALAQQLGAEEALVATALAGQSPQQRAEELVRSTTLKDIETRRRLAEGGKKAITESKDPLIVLARQLEPESRVLRERFENDIESAQRDGYAKLAAARFALFGQDIYPDATFTLRYSFGPIKGYREEGKNIAPFTTLGGTFKRLEERKGQTGFALPQRWLDGKGKLDLNTPYNFVCTADIIGGNSGSPVLNTKGEVIGLIFDGNIQSLVYDIAYTEETARAVAVDARAIMECLRKLYDADPLAHELTGN